MKRISLIAALIALVSGPAVAAPRPMVTVAQGRLAGVDEGGLRVFRGIPFAAPPVGERRWRPPVAPSRWQGVRDASAFGASCMQQVQPADGVYSYNAPALSEDCLTLNVWAEARARRARRAPVIVWIHGGSLRTGGSAAGLFDGANFARRGVVFVSINYRLGVFGWLAHPGLNAESPQHVSGNYGLLDQIAALKWVRANIARFGGDASNVTVMGESAGALSVTFLLSSPLARGLFAKAIAESPNMRAMPELGRPAYGAVSASASGAAFAAAVGVEDIGALRRTDAEALQRVPFVPQGTIDGWALPRQVVDTFDRGEQARVPVLAGFNSGEVRTQMALVPAAPASAQVYADEIGRRYRDLAPAFLALYPASDLRESSIAMTRDAVYGWATERLVRSQARAGLPAYLYLFDHCYPSAAAKGLCNFHASELPFVFGNLTRVGPGWPKPDGAGDRALSDTMIDYWVAFAKTGRAWTPYGRDEAYMHFGETAVEARDLYPGMFELHEEVMRRRRAMGLQWFINVGVAAPVTCARIDDPACASGQQPPAS